MSRAPSRLRDFLCNDKLIRNPRGWARDMAEEAKLETIPSWLLEKVVIDDKFMRLASENIKKSVETIKTEEDADFNSEHRGGVVWVNLEDLTITIPIQGGE